MSQHFHPPRERTPLPMKKNIFSYGFVQLSFSGCLPIYPGWLLNVYAAGPKLVLYAISR